MVQTKSFLCFLTISIFFISFLLYQATASGGSADEHSAKHNRQPKKNHMKQKQSHFKFYWHDVTSGTHATAINIIKPVSNNSFGAVVMIDDLLTQGRNPGSKALGRAQGFYAVASLQKEAALLMVMNFIFTTGKYNGSTISIMGRNPVFNKVREMPVTGGTGLFRFCSGYVEARTKMFNLSTGDAIVMYDVYLMHYVY